MEALPFLFGRLVIILEKPVAGTSPAALMRFMSQAQRAAGLRGEVNVVVTSRQKIRKLNHRYRGKDSVTDVLSFPADGGAGKDFAGDIAICAQEAAAGARRFGHTPSEELKILLLHGILHLAGYDHERDNGRMARMERELRSKLGLPTALIARNQDDDARPAQLRPGYVPRRKGRDR